MLVQLPTQCQGNTVHLLFYQVGVCRCCCTSDTSETVASKNERKGNTKLKFEPLNADCGFTQRPKFAAAGFFTQIDPIVCTLRKTHTDTNNPPSDIFQHVRFRFAQLQPDGQSVWECVSVCVLSLRLAANSAGTRKPGKLCISKRVDSLQFLLALFKKTSEEEGGTQSCNGIKELFISSWQSLQARHDKSLTNHRFKSQSRVLAFTDYIFHRLKR